MGGAHSGYPFMFGWEVDKDLVMKYSPEMYCEEWGNFHEIGHNFQDGRWQPTGCGEVG